MYSWEMSCEKKKKREPYNYEGKVTARIAMPADDKNDECQDESSNGHGNGKCQSTHPP